MKRRAASGRVTRPAVGGLCRIDEKFEHRLGWGPQQCVPSRNFQVPNLWGDHRGDCGHFTYGDRRYTGHCSRERMRSRAASSDARRRVTWPIQPLEVYAGVTKSLSNDSARGPSSVCPAEIFKSQIFWGIIGEITYGDIRYTGHCSREQARPRAA